MLISTIVVYNFGTGKLKWMIILGGSMEIQVHDPWRSKIVVSLCM